MGNWQSTLTYKSIEETDLQIQYLLAYIARSYRASESCLLVTTKHTLFLKPCWYDPQKLSQDNYTRDGISITANLGRTTAGLQ
jgi:hypothetical protein